MKKIVVVVVIILMVSGCEGTSQISVDYKKPYLTIDRHGFNKYKDRIIMHDYDTKEWVIVNTHNIDELLNISAYNKKNDDNLFFHRYKCEILVVHRDSTSEIFNPCAQNKIISEGSMASITLNDQYILISYNRPSEDRSVENEDYMMAIFNHKYNLIDVVNIKNDALQVVLDDDNIKYVNYKEYYPEKKLDRYLVTYNIKQRKETSRVRFENRAAVTSMIINDGKLIYTAYPNHLYIDKETKIDSKPFSNIKVQDLRIDNVNFIYQDTKLNDIITMDSLENGNSYYLRIGGDKLTLESDNQCKGITKRYTAKGQYCINQKNDRIIFQDFKNQPLELDIKIGEGKDEYYDAYFYEWH